MYKNFAPLFLLRYSCHVLSANRYAKDATESMNAAVAPIIPSGIFRYLLSTTEQKSVPITYNYIC